MLKLRSTKLMCLLIAFVWTTVIIGSSYAYFIDSVQVNGNIVTTGNLKAEMQWSDDMQNWHDIEDVETPEDDAIFSGDRWEPNYTEVKYIKIKNTGNLAFQYRLDIVPMLSPTNPGYKLGEVIEAYVDVVDDDYKKPTGYKDFEGRDPSGTIASMIASDNGAYYGTLLNAQETITLAVALHMQHTAGNEYQGLSVGDGFNLRLYATQTPFEYDSFGNTYDDGAASDMPKNEFAGGSASGNVSVVNGVTTTAVNLSGGAVQAYVPAGVKVNDGVTKLTLSVTVLEESQNGIKAGKGESLLAVDVHVDGLSADNNVPLKITLSEALAAGLNVGNTELYHVENGKKVAMTQVMSDAELNAHNEYYYNPVDGTLTLNMATFSEVAVVSEEPKWEGKFDYTWYDANATELTIANADQLAAFGAIVGGMNGQTKDSFAGKTVKLIADVHLGDKESENDPDLIFYPIGYYNTDGTYEKTNKAITSGFQNFEGTFDGNGHTIANFYQNTWEMKGDNDQYDAKLQYYRDGMGLFGKVYGGTVKNLTVDNFSSDGEYTTTGVIAAYADFGANFENIAITNCNPRVYNIGNGGIVGCVGWYTKDTTTNKVSFKNITVDNSNKISALWGSYDVACGGLVGQYYPISGQTSAGSPKNAGVHFENCHVSAQMDVYNDVCGNYQYYAYRYAGMIIGSIRENTTNEDGKTIPDMTGISATGCTVNYGDWNDYYYCEFVKNGHPSYSGPNDYKFSRVDKSDVSFDENGNSIGCTHDHKDVEDNRGIYLPFHQLFTGYGWGVNSIGLEKYSGIVTNLDITEGDQEKSVVKFAKADAVQASYITGTSVTIGDLFKKMADAGVEIKRDDVQVFVSPANKDSTAGGTYKANTDDWTQGELTFTGMGAATITITDYYFCMPTTINVTIDGTEKFVKLFDKDFLYRVGNENTVALGSLFAEIADVTDGKVAVTFDTVKGNASGTYTANVTEWTKGTIQFSGTGVVKVTISGSDAIPVPLTLEVIDATNLTSATGTTTGGNFVLLCDVNTSTYVNYWKCTLYGNGFTYSLKGAPTAYNSKQGKGVIITKNATLDNLVIVGDVYNSYGAYTNQDYYNTAIDVTGDTTIQNCYISGCAAPVRARNNVTIKNTTLYGGAVSNMIIESGTATLENVTTANYDDGREVVGMGIVVHSDATEAAKLVLNGTLTQYNFISESKVPTDTYAKNLHNAMFNSDCSDYHFGTSPNRYVNAGIVSLSALFNAEDITDNANTGYKGTEITANNVNCYVYTQPKANGSVNNDYVEESDPHVSTTQGAVPPSYIFDYTNKNNVAKTEGSNDYCYEENGKVNISMDQGDTFNWDTSILTIGKGITNYTVSMNGTDYTGKSIAFNTAGDYKVEYTYTDDNNFGVDEDGNITTYSVTYTKTVNITVAVVKASTKHAEFTFGSSNTASTTVTVGNSTYVMPNVSGTSSTIGSTTVSGQTIYYPIVEIIMSDGKTSHSSGWYAYFPVFSGAVTITDYANSGTGDKMTPYNGSTTTMPSGMSVVGDAKTLFKYQSGSNAGETPVVKDNKLVYSSAKIEANRNEFSTVVQYSYQDNAGATYYYYIGYHAPAQSYSNSCVTPDTLVTLADGTKKEIQHVTYEDQLLVWDFYKGEYAVVPSAIIFNHGEDDFNIVHLTFEDGTVVKVIKEHRFLDATSNEFVRIDEFNAQDYIGHSFYKQDGDGYNTTNLVKAEVKLEHSVAYSLISALHYNFFVEDLFSSPFLEKDVGAFEYFDIAEDELKYINVEEDIAKYGLYSYEEFAPYITKEQYDAFNAQYMKIAVGKGDFTFEEILRMINEYLTEAQ